MARLWIEDEEELLMDCMNRRMTVRETFNEFEYCGFDRTLKSIEYKRSKINKTWAYDHDTGKAMSEKTKVTYPKAKDWPKQEESIFDWLFLTCLTIGAIITVWWYIS